MTDSESNLKERIYNFLGLNKTVLALSIARMGDAMGNSILFIIIPIYVTRMKDIYFHLPLPVLVGILLSMYGFMNSLLQPFMGALSDRLGKRKLLIIAGLIIMALSTLTFILAHNFYHLLILRTLQGVGVAITIPASMALMTTVTRKETRGGAMGVYSTLRVIGFAIGPLIGGFIQVHFGFVPTFLVGAGFLFLAAFLVQIWVDDAPMPEDKHTKVKFKVFDRSLMTAGIMSTALATFVMASSFSMVTTLENEFNARLGINAFDFSIAFSALMIGRLIFQVPLGRFSDYIGRKPIILLGLILLGPVTALLGEVTSLLQLVLLRIVQGVASAGIAAPAFAVAGDLSTSGGEGRQMSIITTGFGLGLASGPLIAGLFAVVFFEFPFLTLGVFCWITTWVIYHYMPETVERETAFFNKKNSRHKIS
jgi:MFS family permease